jgi:hypothetical protein
VTNRVEIGTMADVKWAFTADYVETCNCNYGCPCNFNGFPTNNTCEALVGYHIRHGHYGEVSLGGLDCIYAGAWPNPIHEGHGTATLFITDKGSPAQRDALEDILTGQVVVPGQLEVALEGFTNQVTGAPNNLKIKLENGFIWKVAHAAKTKIMQIFGGGLNFDHSGQNAFHTVVEFHEV